MLVVTPFDSSQRFLHGIHQPGSQPLLREARSRLQPELGGALPVRKQQRCLAHLAPNPLGAVTADRRTRADVLDHQRLQSSRIEPCILQCIGAAKGMPHQDETPQFQMRHQIFKIVDIGLGPVTGGIRPVTVATTTLVKGVAAVPLAQCIGQAIPGLGIGAQPMEQHHRNARRIAPGQIMQAQPRSIGEELAVCRHSFASHDPYLNTGRHCP
ncbi:hypothetical protein D3C84_754230 [compost metagenome]